MVNGEITPIWVSSKQVVLLFIYNQFLCGETVSVQAAKYSKEMLTVKYIFISVPGVITHQFCFQLKSLNLRAFDNIAPFEAKQPFKHPSV